MKANISVRSAGLALITLCLMLVTGCEPDPIIGKWSVSRNGAEVLMEFRPDNTVTVDLSRVEAAARSKGVSPKDAERLFGKVRRSHVTWRRAGSLYRVETSLEGRTAPPRYLKLEGDRLVPCSQDGKPTGEPEIRRR